MAGALDFLTVQGPRPASYTPPTVSSDWIGNLPEDFEKGQQYGRLRQLQNLFQPGTPGAAALTQAGFGPNTVTGQIAQAGGAESVGQLLPLLMQQQMAGSLPPVASATDSGGAQQSALPTGGADPRGMMPTVLDAAQQNNIDPRRLAAVARGEGLADYHGDYENGKPTSFGALQLHYGGRTKGLGDDYFAETGKDPRDAKNEKDMIYWAARKIRETGWTPWSAARKLGFGKWDGIGQQTAAAGTPGTRSDQLNPTDRAAVKAMYPSGAATPAVEQPPGSTGQHPYIAQPGAASNKGNTGPAGITLAQQDTTQPATPDVAKITRPTDTEEKLKNLDTTIAQMSGQAEKQAVYNKALAEQTRKSIEPLQKERDEVSARMTEQRKADYGVETARRQAEATADVATYGKEYTDTQQKGEDASKAAQTLHLAQAFMNDPSFNSGTFAGNKLAYKRFMVAIGQGDSTQALTQEGFKKATSEAILEQLKSLGGLGLGQVKAKEFETMQKAAQSDENTPATNRLLTEMGLRLAERWQIPLAQQAREYRASHGGHLDAGWDAQKANYVEHTPLFSPDELEDSRRIAPTFARTVQEAKAKGWHEGEPLLVPDPKTGGRRIITHLQVRVPEGSGGQMVAPVQQER